MDSGLLSLAWCQGYDGSKLSYLEPDVICYQCGRNVKTISKDGKHSSFAFKGSFISSMAVHSINKHIAIAENGTNPNIYIYAYPTFAEVSVLEGGAEIEFQKVVFSESDYLASVSGIPNFQMVLWDYLQGAILTSVSLSPEPVTTLSFNKTNWRQICVMTKSSVTLWNTEQCNSKFIVLPQKIKLPAVDPSSEYLGEKDEDQTHERASTKMSKYAVEIPESSVAGLVGEQTEQLEDIKDHGEHVLPVSLTWLPTGDFYVGCEGSQLLKVDCEMLKVQVIYSPPLELDDNPFDRGLTAVSRGETDMPPMDTTSLILKPGSMNCLALQQKGLYAAGKDGKVRLLDVSGDELKIQGEINAGAPVTALCLNTNYQSLAWGSEEGSISSFTCGDPSSVVTLASLHSGNIVGVGSVAIGSECSVSLRESGLVQVWKTTDGTLMSEVKTHEPGEIIACSSALQYAVVGTKGGQLSFIDLTDPNDARIVLQHRLFKSPIKHLVFNGDAGTVLFVASDDNHIFLIDAKPTCGFSILGYVTVTGNIQHVATYMKDNTTVLVASANSKPEIFGSNLLFKLTFTDDLIRDIRFNYKSAMCDINEEACMILKMGLKHAICGLAIGEGEVVFALDANTKRLVSFSMPDPDKKLKKVDLLLTPNAEYPGHELPGGDLLLSPHLKWLLTFGPDGHIKIRTIGGLERTASIMPHEYLSGGVRAVTFSDDCQYVLSCGYDGIISCYHWNHSKSKAGGSSNSAKQRRFRNMEFIEAENNKLREYHMWRQAQTSYRRPSQLERERRERIEHAKQEAQDRDDIYCSPPPSPRADATWLEQRDIDAMRQENEHYAGVKHDLRSQIRDIRKTIQSMMAQNSDLPDIEKLSRHEFDLDLEEQNRLQVEGEAEIKKVREDIEYENLAKLYLREKIKEECWDKMNVKGRALQAFGSSLEVSNFPLRSRPLNVMKMISIVTARRKIEVRELETRRQLVEANTKPVAGDEDGEGDEKEAEGQDHPSISGSLGASYGGGNELFYSQFDLNTREQKVQQIILLEDAIHRIKEAFNKEFDEVYSKKESEISKVKDKNKRISKIISYLGFSEDVVDPSMNIGEKPELLLEVADSEITVERYLTPEQRKKLEEEQRLEAERIAQEKGDNARERALDMMMGGVLEVKKEDVLKKDVPKPAFMLTKKEDDYSEDEVKLVKDYQKKVQELNEEREKYRKQLETELRKHQATIQENLQAFDDTLNVLFMRKIKVMMVIYQEELKILRLRQSMLIQEEIEIRERDLTQTLEHKRNLKQLAFEAVAETRKNVENFRNEYDNLQAEDKYLDKAFRREFGDVSAIMVDALYKQFRKRPKIHKYRPYEAADRSSNPFIERPSTSMLTNHQNNSMNRGLRELDNVSQAPEGCDTNVWERLCKIRRVKMESENLLKIKSNVLAEMLTFMQKRQEEDDRLKSEIEDIGHQLNKLKEDEQRFILNLEVQLLLKQGQIEVDAGPFIRDFRDSVLVHRSVVEDLNSTIKQLGESKIASMVESKDFRKGIIQLEWEHKKMSMQMEDLKNRMKDIQFIKVTREIQAFLQEEDYESKKSAEIATLEQTILLQRKFHEKNVQEKKLALKDLSKKVKYKVSANTKLDSDLLDLNVVVNERRLIDEVNVENRQEGAAEKRYQEIVQRRKLVDLAKAQAQEVAVLRAEVERLRMRTFPALVQVER